MFTNSPFSQEAPSPVEHTPSAISIETLWTQSTALASSSSSLQRQTPPPAPPATTSSASVSPICQFGVDRKRSNQTHPLPHSKTPFTPYPLPHTPSASDVLVWPTNWDCDRWLTLTMLQFHPIALAMTADGVLRIVCMRLCREPIKVVTTLPPLPPPPPTHTHTHTLSTPQTCARQCCRVVSTCATWHTYAYFFSRTPTCSTCRLYICVHF